MIGDRLERDWTAPPYDALAEAIVLRGLLLRPESIVDYDPALLLVFPEHRLILDCMKRAHAVTIGQSWGHFYIAWMDECEVAKPGHVRALVRVLDGVSDDESRWIWRDSERSRSQGMGMADSHHDFQWWWQRLRDVAESRRILSSLSTAEDAAWKGDIDGARKAVQAIRQPPPAAIRIDIA